MQIGIDIGSTTLKVIVLDIDRNIIYKSYNRHKADITNVLFYELNNIDRLFPKLTAKISITGSAGMGVAERLNIPFHQEVVASIAVIREFYNDTRTLVDLGGEDAKIVFFEPEKQPDIRMNGSCAGGTGAFIDQMADLLDISIERLNAEALKFEKIYPVASRCGVFAKTDVQNLIARNTPLPDLAMSVFHTVANQAITTLIRGHKVSSKVLFVGGPLTFIPALANRFKTLLHKKDNDVLLPENSEFFPAWGSALLAVKEAVEIDIATLKDKLLDKNISDNSENLPPLFQSDDAYEDWLRNKKIIPLKRGVIREAHTESCFLGIDSGSTTTKIVVINLRSEIIFDYYILNKGNPMQQIADGLSVFYNKAKERNSKIDILASCSTGYGEELVQEAFNLNFGVVETIAHLTGAKFINPKVSFILDIGGQDMKSIFINDGIITNIELNEACSSGCGSFLQNFASLMNITIDDFAKKACMAQNPVDLGTRCTVFMNSKVKQSLRQNNSLGDIAAGLAYSVIKNCLFKVLKISNLNILGDNIVVQGGTFKNNAVFRALEVLSQKAVYSTDSPELMGAFGAALYAQQQAKKGLDSYAKNAESNFQLNYKIKELKCGGCTNKCQLLRFDFDNGNVCYSGNKCEKVFTSKHRGSKKGINCFELRNSLLFNNTIEI